jgi:hypothetical protein
MLFCLFNHVHVAPSAFMWILYVQLVSMHQHSVLHALLC